MSYGTLAYRFLVDIPGNGLNNESAAVAKKMIWKWSIIIIIIPKTEDTSINQRTFKVLQYVVVSIFLYSLAQKTI